MTRDLLGVVLVSFLASLASLASCAVAPQATTTPRPPRTLTLRADDEDLLSLPGSLRRQIQGFREIPVVASIEATQVAYVIASVREETQSVHPKVGPAFSVTQGRWRLVTHRDVQCVPRDLPGESLHGTVREVTRLDGVYGRARVVVSVDNSRQLLVPGMVVALAIDADRKAVVALGDVAQPDPKSEASNGRMWVEPALAKTIE